MKKLSVILVLCLSFFMSSAHASKYWRTKRRIEANTQLLNEVLVELRDVKQTLKEIESRDCEKGVNND